MNDFDPETARWRWSPIVIDKAIAEFEPRPPADTSYRPDTVHDGWSSDELTLRMASVRGYGHRYDGRPREDDAAAFLHRPTGALLFAVADGVSGAGLPHIAATLASRSAIDVMARTLDGDTPAIEWAEVLRHAAWQLVERVAQILRLPEPDPARTPTLLATTLLAGLVFPSPTGHQVRMGRIGDTTAWQLQEGKFRELFPGRATSSAVVDHGVSSLPSIPDKVDSCELHLAPGAALVVGTDGFADPLGDGSGAIGQVFATLLQTPPPARGLAQVLDFSRDSFDDDRTLLAIWPRSAPVPEGAEVHA